MSIRRTVIGSFAAVAAPLALTGAVAFACITPATVSLSSASGRPGEVITITGQSFSLPENATTGVQVRWGGAEGRLLAEAWPDGTGAFKTTFTVPDGPPGFYPVTAVLRDASGNDVPGTPGRALFEIRLAPAPPAPEPAVATFTPADTSGSSFPIALVFALGGVGLVLFAGGALAVSRSRRSGSATPARVRQD